MGAGTSAGGSLGVGFRGGKRTAFYFKGTKKSRAESPFRLKEGLPMPAATVRNYTTWALTLTLTSNSC